MEEEVEVVVVEAVVVVVVVVVVVEAVVVHQHVELTILLRESLRFFAPFSLLLNELITVELQGWWWWWWWRRWWRTLWRGAVCRQ